MEHFHSSHVLWHRVTPAPKSAISCLYQGESITWGVARCRDDGGCVPLPRQPLLDGAVHEILPRRGVKPADTVLEVSRVGHTPLDLQPLRRDVFL